MHLPVEFLKPSNTAPALQKDIPLVIKVIQSDELGSKLNLTQVYPYSVVQILL